MRYQMITANRLLDGGVVYLDARRGWTGDVTQGETVAEENADSRMSIARQSAADQVIVTPYVIDVEVGKGQVNPSGTENKFGPTARASVS